jgi:hypothetical protein
VSEFRPPQHTWTCPGCGRRVPLRITTCYCGRASESTAATPEHATPEPAPRARPLGWLARAWVLWRALPRDVQALAAVGVVVVLAGAGWITFVPARPDRTPALLGHLDATPPPTPPPAPPPKPPFKLPWWR